MNALEDIVQESGISLEDITAVADKGCTSGTLMDTFEGGNTKYVFRIKRGTYGLSEKTPLFEGYDGAFSYRSRGVKHYTYECDDHKSKVVFFLDLFLLAHEGSSRIVRCELSAGKVVKQVQKDLNQRQKKLEKARTGLEASRKNCSKSGRAGKSLRSRPKGSKRETWLICIEDTTLPHKFIGTSKITAFQNISEHKHLVTDEPGFERGIL